MGLRFKFNENAWVQLADACRKASWSLGPLSGFFGSYYGIGWALVASAMSWFALQLAAFILSSVSAEVKNECCVHSPCDKKELAAKTASGESNE